MNMTIAGISANVDALLKSMTNFDSASVLNHAPDDNETFGSYPAVAHYYTGTDPSYATVSQNRRVVDYIVEVYLIPDKATDGSTVFNDMYALVDDVLNKFDKSQDLSDSVTPLTRACDIMRPAPAQLERVETNEGVGLMCTIHLYCEADITFTNS